jgi:membrane-associated HD superfamily phosphohydrolase
MFDKQVQNLGSFFMHNTNRYENKICLFGKLMAVIAVILAFIRLYLMSTNYDKSDLFYKTLIFDLTCLSLALMMNLNAAIYLIPIIVCEILILIKL